MNCQQISDAFYGGLIGSLATWIFIFIGQRVFNWIRLFGFRGHYKGFDMDAKPHQESKVYSVKYSFMKNKLVLNQSSNKEGNWKAKIPINSWNPITGTGNFFYLDDGKYDGDWGFMQVWLNIKTKIITIEATPRSREGKGIAKYYLEKSK